MTQALPSTLLYAQAIELIDRLRKDYADKKFRSSDEVLVAIKSILTRFDLGAGHALTSFDEILKSEIPRSTKMNAFWSDLQSDVNILQNQLDALRASTIFTHNYIKTEVLKAQSKNRQLRNKIKTLELYSESRGTSLLTFGDSFINDEFIDWEWTPTSDRAFLMSSGYIGLNTDQQTTDNMKSATVTILPSSNGFAGNNQEINDPALAPIDPVTKDRMITFKAETKRAADTKAILDGQPNTWFEYEHYEVSATDRAKAKNLNFVYKSTDSTTGSGGYIDWASGPIGDTLSLEFEIDLGKSKKLNIINFIPFGLADNSNNPIKILEVNISDDGIDWTMLSPNNVWIVNGIDKKITSIAGTENILVNQASWIVQGVFVRYIRFKIEQSNPIRSNIGHLYYIDQKYASAETANNLIISPTTDYGAVTYDMPVPYESSIIYGGGLESATPSTGGVNEVPGEIVVIERKEGPIPDINRPNQYFSINNIIVNGLAQRREYFVGKRWAIGIRDISMMAHAYKQKSVFISKRFEIPGIVDRVALEADLFIPYDFDQTVSWVKFYISPNEGTSWYQISRIQDDFLNIPEIIAFNDPTPLDLREPGVAYYDVAGTVNTLRLKVEFTRPVSNKNVTPILQSYKLKVKRH